MYFSQEEIIKFIAIAFLAYLPLSILIIKIIEKLKNKKIISGGVMIEGVVLGIFASVINLFGLFAIMIIDSLGALMLGSGKSSLLAKNGNYFVVL